jgi:hypothetical protein
MDLELLQKKWTDLDRRLERSLRLDAQLLRRVAFGQTRTHLDRLRRWLVLALLQDAAFVMLFGAFVADHLAEPRFLVPGLVLHLLAIAALGGTIRQLVLARGLDFAAPVAAAQHRLAALRRLRIATTKWILVLAPLVWTPLLIVALRGLLGADIYQAPLQGWLLGNALFGVACVPLLLWLARRFADRLDRSPFLQRLARDLAGANLTAAQAELLAVAEFEREGTAWPG